MTDLEICRLSAEALGKNFAMGEAEDEPYVWLLADGDLLPQLWNPLDIAEQRWECVEWLLRSGYTTAFLADGTCQAVHKDHLAPGEPIEMVCPASEFPARAVAELRRRQK